MNLRISRKINSKIGKAEFVISLMCFINKIPLSESEITILAYYCIYGVKETTDKLIIDSKIMKVKPLGNVKTKLVQLKLLKRDDYLYKTYQLNDSEGPKINEISSVLINLED